MPFAWGANDCCTFAAAAVEAITGANPMTSIEGYDSAFAAARLVNEAGGLEKLATSVLGEPVSPRMAAVGDVVLLLNEGRELLGVCNGTSAIAPGRLHMTALSMDAALMAWRI